MSFKIRNAKLAGQTVVMSEEGHKQFDAEGIVEIESEGLYHDLLRMANFHAVLTEDEIKAAQEAEQARIDAEEEEYAEKLKEEAHRALLEEQEKAKSAEEAKKIAEENKAKADLAKDKKTTK